MGLIQSGFSAVGKLVIVAGLLGAFLLGMAGVVYMSLKGEEITVPEIVGKDFSDSEKELVSLGLKIKKRADRFSTEKPNTILEQLPKSGETVKTGQMILVVISKTGGEGEETPSTLKKTSEENDTEKIEQMISDKPKKKTNSNTNKKKAETTRDVIGNTSNSNSNSNSDKKEPANDKAPDKDNKTTPANKPANPSGTKPGKPKEP